MKSQIWMRLDRNRAFFQVRTLLDTTIMRIIFVNNGKGMSWNRERVSIGLTSREKVPLCLRRRDWHFLANCWIHITVEGGEKSCQPADVLSWNEEIFYSTRQENSISTVPQSFISIIDGWEKRFHVGKFPLFSLVNFKAWFSQKTKLRYL